MVYASSLPYIQQMCRTKQGMRERAKLLREELTPELVAQKSHVVCEALLPLLEPFRTIMVYASKCPEVETMELITCLIQQGKRVVVPIIERETCSLRLSYLVDPSVLVPSTFNVPEPLGHEIPAGKEEIEAVVIPMLAFDAAGNRLGYGAGYYDRFLATDSHSVKIGVAFSCQETEKLPCDANDVRMDFIVTETGIISCG
jgi:5-formyltetrahydrofolate cyclo-ligase